MSFLSLTRVNSVLESKGLALGRPSAPVAAYSAFVVARPFVYISGQLPFVAARELLHQGSLGRDVSLEQARACAQQAILNFLSQLYLGALGGDENIAARIVKINVFVSCTNDFFEQPKVADGASELLREIWGAEPGIARSAVGVAALPGNTPVEIDGICQIESS